MMETILWSVVAVLLLCGVVACFRSWCRAQDRMTPQQREADWCDRQW